MSIVSIGNQGHITTGPDVTLVARTIDFIYDNLVPFRDDKPRPDVHAEVELNVQLCDFLDNRARFTIPMIRFSHEEPQAPRRRVDISAKPTANATTRDPSLSIYRPILTIEGKRLPAPTANREREYLTGDPHLSGGVQRFKLALHGSEHVEAVMVGYIQERDSIHWFGQINGWVSSIVETGSTDNTVWDIQELLAEFQHDQALRISRSRSQHIRNSNIDGDMITLHHLWVEMKRA